MLSERRCGGCGERDWVVCPSCVAGLRPAPPITVGCTASAAALLAYEGAARDLVVAFKYGRDTQVGKWLGSALVQWLGARHLPIGAVTWIPTSGRRRRRRGFDQARVLARLAALGLGLPLVTTLARRSSRPQTGLGRRARLDGPRLEPVRRRPAPTGTGRPVLLVIDDVITTGATAAAACRTLTGWGFPEPHFRALAATPG